MAANLHQVDDAEVRAAAVFALGSFIMSCEHGDGMLDSQGGSMQENERLAAEREIACYLIKV